MSKNNKLFDFFGIAALFGSCGAFVASQPLIGLLLLFVAIGFACISTATNPVGPGWE